MWNEPSLEYLARMPGLYTTENTPWRDKIIYEHFWLGGSDWYVAEFDPNERLFFGYAILNDDLQNSEWGYFSLDELRFLRIGAIEVDCELDWRDVPASEIERIVLGMRDD